MNRTWITGLTLASVAGSGGAFAAAATSGNDTPVAAQAPAVVNAGDFVQEPTGHTIDYQVGTAGTVTLTVGDGVMTVTRTTFGTGWTGAATVVAGRHVEVQFTDAAQLVTFGADLVGDQPVVALTNVPAAGAASAVPAPIDITVVGQMSTPSPRPATAQPAASWPPANPTTVQSPSRAATTAPSGGGDDHSSNDRGDDGHEESDDD